MEKIINRLKQELVVLDYFAFEAVLLYTRSDVRVKPSIYERMDTTTLQKFGRVGSTSWY
jgi:hypothetical protein